MQNIYDVPLLVPPEYHHEETEYLHATTQGIKYHKYEIDGMAQANKVLASINSAVMAQLDQLTAEMGEMQAQLKNLSSTEKKTKQ